MPMIVKTRAGTQPARKNSKARVKNSKHLIHYVLAISFIIISMIAAPVQTKAANSILLIENMKNFKTVYYGGSPHYVIETSGKHLKEIFGSGTLGALNDEDQYFAFFHNNKKRSGLLGWSTYLQICHTRNWDGIIPGGRDQMNIKKSDELFRFKCFEASVNKNYGKKDFYNRGFGYGLPSIGAGRLGTLFYKNISEKQTNQALTEALQDQDEGSDGDGGLGSSQKKQTNLLKVYFSPVITKDTYNSARTHKSIIKHFFRAEDWQRSGCTQESLASCRTHYDVKFEITVPSVTVNERYRGVGKNVTDYKVLKTDKTFGSAATSHNLRATTNKEIKEGKKRLYTYGSDKPYSIYPDNTDGKAQTHKVGNRVYGFVGFKAWYKKSNNQKYCISSEMLKLKKSKGIYVIDSIPQEDVADTSSSDGTASGSAGAANGSSSGGGDSSDDGNDSGSQEEADNASEEANQTEIENSAESDNKKKKETDVLTLSDVKKSQVTVQFDRRFNSKGNVKKTRTNTKMTYTEEYLVPDPLNS